MRGDIARVLSRERSESAAPWPFWLQKDTLNLNEINGKSLSDFRPGKLHGQVTADCQGKEPQAAGIVSESTIRPERALANAQWAGFNPGGHRFSRGIPTLAGVRRGPRAKST